MDVKLLRAWILLLVPLLLLPLWTASLPGEAQQPVRAIIVSWDGMVPLFINDLLRQGKLPNLARLIAEGAFVDSVITTFPSKTAPGHASLWTGAPPRINGVSGNITPRTPRNQATILDSVSGFLSTSLKAEPLWMTAARSGRRVVIVQATQAWPFESYLSDGPFGPGEPERLMLFEGYAGISGRDGIITARETAPRPAQAWKNPPSSVTPPLEIAFTIGATRLFGLLIDEPGDPARGYDTLLIGRRKDGAEIEARLKPGTSAPGKIDRWSSPVNIEVPGKPLSGTHLRLFDLKFDGSDFLLYFTRPAARLASRPEHLPVLQKEAGAFVGNGAASLYRQGGFGPAILDGGDGMAERRYLETALFTLKQVAASTRWAMQSLPWDLLFTYSPYPDESEHLWRGYLDPGLPQYRKAVADRLAGFLEEVYRAGDEFLGQVMSTRPPNTALALVSDHGMEGANKAVRINAALRQAGLLALDRRGRVDLSKTKAYYPGANSGHILLNTTDRKGGIVGPDERPKVVAQIRRVLDNLTDNGQKVVTGVFDAEVHGEAMGIGGEAGGDIYLDLRPGYDFEGQLGEKGLIVEREPSGTHVFNPVRKSMRTLMVLSGPGIAPGSTLSQARTIDFAPTVAEVLGLPRPRHATGRVLVEVLSRKVP